MVCMLMGIALGFLLGARVNICPNCKRGFLHTQSNGDYTIVLSCKKCGALFTHYKKERER